MRFISYLQSAIKSQVQDHWQFITIWFLFLVNTTGFSLLGRHASSLVPGVVEAVVLNALLLRLLLRWNKPTPSVLLAMFNCLFLRVELDIHIRQRISGWSPAHQRILPALAVVELHSPCLKVVGAALHYVLWWNEDTNATIFYMFLGNTADWSKRFLENIELSLGNIERFTNFYLLGKLDKIWQLLAFLNFSIRQDNRVVDDWCLLMLQSIAWVSCRVLNPKNNNNKYYLTNFLVAWVCSVVSYHLNDAGAFGRRRSNVAIIVNQKMFY